MISAWVQPAIAEGRTVARRPTNGSSSDRPSRRGAVERKWIGTDELRLLRRRPALSAAAGAP